MTVCRRLDAWIVTMSSGAFTVAGTWAAAAASTPAAWAAPVLGSLVLVCGIVALVSGRDLFHGSAGGV